MIMNQVQSLATFCRDIRAFCDSQMGNLQMLPHTLQLMGLTTEWTGIAASLAQKATKVCVHFFQVCICKNTKQLSFRNWDANSFSRVLGCLWCWKLSKKTFGGPSPFSLEVEDCIFGYIIFGYFLFIYFTLFFIFSCL
eukprot:EG_transcript_15905